jgi:hypothetical protein
MRHLVRLMLLAAPLALIGSLPCTMATAAADCPVPSRSGACNVQGFCKP